MQLGKMPFEPVTRDFIPFFNEVIKNFQMIFPDRKLEITNPFDLIEMTFDGKLLEHAFNNIFNNANKYSPKDTIIKIELANTNEVIQLTVIDYGIGIPEEEQIHLFSSFFRASNTISHHGTGLGLGIVKQFIEGCKVVITLPKSIQPI
jgi:signal transduction histidine kinase